MREIQILSLQARILLLTGWAWILIGLWLGHDPLMVSWRAVVAAILTMMVGGWLLRVGAEALPAEPEPEATSEADEEQGDDASGNG